MIDHLEIESTCLHKDSAEARKQMKDGGGASNGERGKLLKISLTTTDVAGGIVFMV